MAYENLLLERDGALAILTINRPKTLNALNGHTLEELEAALLEIQRDPHLRVVIVTGAGEKAFIAGADIAEMANMGAVEGEAHARRGQRVVGLLESMPQVTLAAINGYALGGGTEVALACDLRIAADSAQLGLPEVSLGVIPGFGGTQRLARLVGRGRALDVMLTGRRVKADEAERIGLVNRVVPREKLMDEARATAAAILGNGPVAVRLAKEVANRGLETDLATGLGLEEKAFGLVFATHDQKEGMKAFLEKRPAKFEGR